MFARLCLILLSTFLWAADRPSEVQVVPPFAPVYAAPKATASVLTNVKQGTVLKVLGEDSGFYQLKTKSGKTLWIRIVHVKPVGQDLYSEDLERGDSGAPEKISYPKFTFDVNFSLGTNTFGSFYELQAGINTYFNSWLSWRNAPFYRFLSTNSAFGVDTSFRAQTLLPLEIFSPQLLAGVGYRFITLGGSAPFVEAGISTPGTKLFVSFTAKLVLNTLVGTATDNQFLWGFGVSGGGSF
jgi:hypothetical protein